MGWTIHTRKSPWFADPGPHLDHDHRIHHSRHDSFVAFLDHLLLDWYVVPDIAPLLPGHVRGTTVSTRLPPWPVGPGGL